jgi:hypothetical protein
MEAQRYSEQIRNIITNCIDDIAMLVKTYGPIQFPYYINEEYFTIEQFKGLYGDFDIQYGNPFHNLTIRLENIFHTNVIERDIVEIRVEENMPILVTLESEYSIQEMANIMDIPKLYELIVETINAR